MESSVVHVLSEAASDQPLGVSNEQTDRSYVTIGGKRFERPRLDWTGNYNLYILAFSIGLGLPTQLFEFAPSVMRGNVFKNGTGELMAAVVVFSLAAGAAVNQLGVRTAQSAGLVLMIGFMGCLTAIVFLGQSSMLEWPLYMSGGLFCGVAMALMPAALGPAAERTAQLCAAGDPTTSVDQMRSSLMANFAVASNFVQLLIGGSVTIGLLMMELEGVSDEKSFKILFPVLTSFCFLGLANMYLVADFPNLNPGAEKSCRKEVRNLFRLWKDPRIWLLGLGSMCTGLASAWKVSAFSGPLKENIGPQANAIVNNVQCVVSISASQPLHKAMSKTGVMPWIIFGGALYTSMPLLFWVAPSVLSTLVEGWGIVVFYILMGFGWPWYDVVIRAVTLDHFPGEQSP